MQRSPQETAILDEHGLIQMKLGAQQCHPFWGSGKTQHQHDRVAGGELGDGKDEQGNAQ